jgi:hypothetical protein
MLDDESTNVIVMLAPDPASSDTKIDLTTAVFIYKTVSHYCKKKLNASTSSLSSC